MHPEFQINPNLASRIDVAANEMLSWHENSHIAAILRDDPHAKEIFDRTMQLPVMVSAMARADAMDTGELSTILAEGLLQSYADLGIECPQTLAELEECAQLPEASSGTTETARDYLMHRLTGVANIADLSVTMTLPPALHESLQREADRLATLLVLMKRADDVTDEAVAA